MNQEDGYTTQWGDVDRKAVPYHNLRPHRSHVLVSCGRIQNAIHNSQLMIAGITRLMEVRSNLPARMCSPQSN
jgi:hypothetical protein